MSFVKFPSTIVDKEMKPKPSITFYNISCPYHMSHTHTNNTNKYKIHVVSLFSQKRHAFHIETIKPKLILSKIKIKFKIYSSNLPKLFIQNQPIFKLTPQLNIFKSRVIIIKVLKKSNCNSISRFFYCLHNTIVTPII